MNKLTELFGINYPIIAGGMVWCSGWKLAVAVSNAGGLGLIGAGSMHPDTLREHIRKAQAATGKPFGVNVSLLYPEIDKIMHIPVEAGWTANVCFGGHDMKSLFITASQYLYRIRMQVEGIR
jgi:enoyl-[acyl-carrier protein] reductase II